MPTRPKSIAYWNALLEGGLYRGLRLARHRYGVPWQIIPTVLFGDATANPDRVKAKRAARTLMPKMVKIDIAALKAVLIAETSQ